MRNRLQAYIPNGRNILTVTAVMLVCILPLRTQNRLIDLHVSNGKSTTGIHLRWSQISGKEEYKVYRTDKLNGSFQEIATVFATRYDDINCKPGVEYFYKVSVSPHITDTDFSVVQSGYRRIDLSDEFDLDTVISKKNQGIPFVRPVDKERLKHLEPYYISWFKIQLILFVTKPYLYNNRIVILTDFDNFTYDQEQNVIEIYPRSETYQLIFYGREPFELLDQTGDTVLFRRLIENSIAFCVYKGETKIRDRFGLNKYIPKYEAVGLATQYYKYSDRWASETILFSSNRKDIIQEVENK
ncbi:MAG: hypothetical protein ACOC2H_02510 [Spirochaetota bacterium]